MISQLTIFLENEKGRLAAATRVIADAGINMKSLNIAESSEFGVLRVICDTPKAAALALTEAGLRANVTPVMAVEVPNVKGGLADLLQKFDELDINIEYGYCFSVGEETAIDILKVKDPSVEAQVKAAGIKVLAAEDVYDA
jgi:hypothetical protein